MSQNHGVVTRFAARPRKRTYPVENQTPLPGNASGVVAREDSGNKAPVPTIKGEIVLSKIEGDEVEAEVSNDDGPENELRPAEDDATPVQAAIEAEIVTGEDAEERELSEAIAGNRSPRKSTIGRTIPYRLMRSSGSSCDSLVLRSSRSRKSHLPRYVFGR